jgi:NADP-dependent 3-hydroxy acid dehydrogenase YdfG
VESLLSRLPDDWRSIDILVNNAGHDEGGRRRFDEGSADQWASIIETNVIGLIRTTRAVIPAMVERDHGHIVNIGSIAGISPYATGTIYSGSKHAVHGFSESLRLDFAGTGIRVTEILPGLVRTNFALTRWHDQTRADSFYDDFGVCLVPEDIARTVLFAIQQPPNVVISQLVVVPSAQQR